MPNVQLLIGYWSLCISLACPLLLLFHMPRCDSNCVTSEQAEILERLATATHNVRKQPSFETAFILREVVDELKRSVKLDVAMTTPSAEKKSKTKRSNE